MPDQFDVIVVGSGFGGAVCAARLAEAGYRVLVLERGRRWTPDDYPREIEDAWIFDPHAPERRNGWFDFRVFPHMTVVQGAGVGGGSLVYANISVNANDDSFAGGWPPEITAGVLAPHYDRVGQTLNIQKVPARQWPERTRMMKDSAEAMGWGSRFRRLDLAVSFDPNWTYDLPDPHDPGHSTAFVNAQGQPQGTCVHLGTCDIGCKVKARNTLDLTYIPVAERHGADVRPLHVVRAVLPENGGYRVRYDRIANQALVRGDATARLVVLAAGSIGTTELLLRCRDEHLTLPALSPRLGHGWSSNGDFLTPALHPFRSVQPNRGPTITAAIDLLDGAVDGERIFIEDGGFPDVAREAMLERVTRPGRDERETALVESIRVLTRLNAFDHVMPWFAQARDAADGRLWLENGESGMDWDITRSERTIEAVVKTHERLARSLGGMPLVPLTWTFNRDLITPHPLGGANMAADPTRGVVNHAGEVFGYRNLFVADGSVVPEAIGLNPSKTIAALAERTASIIAAEGR